MTQTAIVQCTPVKPLAVQIAQLSWQREANITANRANVSKQTRENPCASAANAMKSIFQ